MKELTEAQGLSKLLSLAIDLVDYQAKPDQEIRAMLLVWCPVVDKLIQHFDRPMTDPTLLRIQRYSLQDVISCVGRLCRHAINLSTQQSENELRTLMRAALNKLEEVGENLGTPLPGSELQCSTSLNCLRLRNRVYDLEHMLKAECEAMELGQQPPHVSTELRIAVNLLSAEINKL